MVVVCGDADAGQGVDAAAGEPVGGALESEDVRVVSHAVDPGGGDGFFAENAASTRERHFAGEHERVVFVAT